MLSKGFKRVGKSFPVFLHPETNDEYALARIERSTGLGYSDFEVKTENVTLKQDLMRRDLTINSLALSEDGTVIDYFGGQSDINKKLLRHTSDAFKEDLLIRTLRLARFKAMLGYDWKIHYLTKLMIYTNKKDLKVQPDRVFKEVEKVMELSNSALFFETLDELDVLEIIFPNIGNLKTLRENNQWHMEPNTFEHIMSMLKLTDRPILKWLALYHDIGKPTCTLQFGHSGGHDDAELVEPLIDIQLPNNIKKQVLFSVDNHIRISLAAKKEMTPKKVAKFFKAFRRNRQWLLDLIELHKIDKLGAIRLNSPEPKDYSWLIEAFDRCLAHSVTKWVKENDPSVESIKQYIHNKHIEIIKEYYN